MLPLAAHGNTDPKMVERLAPKQERLDVVPKQKEAWSCAAKVLGFGLVFASQKRERDRDSAGLGKIDVLEQDS